MPKPPALPSSLKKLDARAAPTPKAATTAPAERPGNPHYRPSRDGQTNLTGYFDPAVKYQLQELTIELSKAREGRVTLQDLHAEMINDLFAKYGKPEIAPVWRKQGQG
jgi:hypothetical protein